MKTKTGDEEKKNPGRIYLVPSALGEGGEKYISAEVKRIVAEIDFFLVENERSARRFLRSIGYRKNFDEGKMILIDDEEVSPDESLMKHLQEGKDAGVISEAGCPGIADPGSSIVSWAHRNNIVVAPLAGASSIFLALMASGLNGQQFAFHGYLPITVAERRNSIRQLEEESSRKKQTQIFMETPYRNDSLLNDVLGICKNKTMLCIATNITLSSEKILTQTIGEWKKKIPDLKKKPTIFLLLA